MWSAFGGPPFNSKIVTAYTSLMAWDTSSSVVDLHAPHMVTTLGCLRGDRAVGSFSFTGVDGGTGICWGSLREGCNWVEEMSVVTGRLRGTVLAWLSSSLWGFGAVELEQGEVVLAAGSRDGTFERAITVLYKIFSWFFICVFMSISSCRSWESSNAQVHGQVSAETTFWVDWYVRVGSDCVEASHLHQWQKNADLAAASGEEKVQEMCSQAAHLKHCTIGQPSSTVVPQQQSTTSVEVLVFLAGIFTENSTGRNGDKVLGKHKCIKCSQIKKWGSTKRADKEWFLQSFRDAHTPMLNR